MDQSEIPGGYVPVCRTSDVPAGSCRMFVVSDVRVAICNIDGNFYAMDDACPHAGASLAMGFVNGDTVQCRIHHWSFCIRNGEYLDEAKPERNARSFAVQVDGDTIKIKMASA